MNEKERSSRIKKVKSEIMKLQEELNKLVEDDRTYRDNVNYTKNKMEREISRYKVFSSVQINGGYVEIGKGEINFGDGMISAKNNNEIDAMCDLKCDLIALELVYFESGDVTVFGYNPGK